MSTFGYPGTFTGGSTTGSASIGAIQKFKSSFGYPGIIEGGYTTGYTNIGAVQRAPGNQYNDTFSDSVTASDSLSATASIATTIADSVTSSDTQGVVLAFSGTLSDTVTGADTQSAIFAAHATFSDTVTSSDTFGATMTGSNTFSDSVTAADGVTGGIGYTFTFSDNITAADAIAGALQAVYTFADGVTTTDSFVGGIGYINVFSDALTASDSFTATVSPQPNLILSGTIDYAYPYRIFNSIATYLNFSVIIGDDNYIQVNVTNMITASPISLAAAVVYFFAPNTNTNPVITKSAICSSGYLQFELAHVDVASLAPALYPWTAVVTLPDGSVHMINIGDANLTTGVMNLLNKPY